MFVQPLGNQLSLFPWISNISPRSSKANGEQEYLIKVSILYLYLPIHSSSNILLFSFPADQNQQQEKRSNEVRFG